MSATKEKSDTSANPTTDREIVLSRRFDAPRALVFEVWTGREHVGHWWGPDGFKTTTHEMDVRPGGVWRYTMHGPDGTDYPNLVDFIEVVKPERLVYWLGSGVADDPQRFHVTVTFEAQGKATLVTMRSVFSTAAIRDKLVKDVNAIEGGKQHLARLAAYLAKM